MLVVLPSDRKGDAIAGRDDDTGRPDLDVEFIGLAGLEGSVKRAIVFENAAREWPAAVAERSS